jgi:TetR/AcrR family transcriptional regulator, transcriptional repressor for nem operon
MPRKAKIEPQELVEKAMHLYWIQGYSGTSVEDITEETGASKSMIYNHDGKKGIFIESFYNYLQNHSNPYLIALENDGRGIEVFREQYRHMIDALLDRSLPKACLFVNTAVEMGKKDPDINELLEVYQKRVKTAYTTVLERSYKLGEIKDRSNIPFFVEILANLLFSIATLYKVKSKQKLHEFLDAQLDLIH